MQVIAVQITHQQYYQIWRWGVLAYINFVCTVSVLILLTVRANAKHRLAQFLLDFIVFAHWIVGRLVANQNCSLVLFVYLFICLLLLLSGVVSNEFRWMVPVVSDDVCNACCLILAVSPQANVTMSDYVVHFWDLQHLHLSLTKICT